MNPQECGLAKVFSFAVDIRKKTNFAYVSLREMILTFCFRARNRSFCFNFPVGFLCRLRELYPQLGVDPTTV